MQELDWTKKSCVIRCDDYIYEGREHLQCRTLLGQKSPASSSVITTVQYTVFMEREHLQCRSLIGKIVLRHQV